MLDFSLETAKAVNLAMLIFCSVEAIIVLLHSPPIDHRTRTARIFITEMVVIVLTVICYTLGLIAELGHEGILSIMLRALAYVGVYVIFYLYILYVIENINMLDHTTQVPGWMRKLSLGVCIIGAALWLMVIFDPWEDYIGEPKSLDSIQYWLGYSGGFVLLLIVVFLLIRYREVLGKRRTGVLFAMPTLLVVATIVEETILHGIELRYPAISLGFVIIYTYHNMEVEYKFKKEEAEHLHNRVSMATARMSPHYLYNVLTSIYYLCETDPKKAQHAIGLFSEYLRNTLETIEKMELVDFNWELDVIRNYLTLEELRFGDRIKVEYDIEFEAFRVPPLSIQPLVENAVKHGLAPKEEGGTLKITTRKLSDDGVQIMISDDGYGFNIAQLKTLEYSDKGISNVRERIKMEIGGELTITSSPGKGTTAMVIIRPDEERRIM